MKRVEGRGDVKVIEWVSGGKNKWGMGWDMEEDEEGWGEYMEGEFVNGRG